VEALIVEYVHSLTFESGSATEMRANQLAPQSFFHRFAAL
jgi:hypothetical protein